jgi:hypothetical protein
MMIYLGLNMLLLKKTYDGFTNNKNNCLPERKKTSPFLGVNITNHLQYYKTIIISWNVTE